MLIIVIRIAKINIEIAIQMGLGLLKDCFRWVWMEYLRAETSKWYCALRQGRIRSTDDGQGSWW